MTSAGEDVDPPFEIYSTIWRTGELYLVARIPAHVAREEEKNSLVTGMHHLSVTKFNLNLGILISSQQAKINQV